MDNDKKSKTLYQKIIDYYINELAAGRLSAGDKLPRGDEIAALFGVSSITVTHAMRQLEALGLIKRIKKKGTFISSDAPSLAAGAPVGGLPSPVGQPSPPAQHGPPAGSSGLAGPGPSAASAAAAPSGSPEASAGAASSEPAAGAATAAGAASSGPTAASAGLVPSSSAPVTFVPAGSAGPAGPAGPARPTAFGSPPGDHDGNADQQPGAAAPQSAGASNTPGHSDRQASGQRSASPAVDETVVVGTPSSPPLVALVIPFDETFGYGIFNGVEEYCSAQGCYVTMHNSRFDEELERDIIKRLIASQVRGIIVYPCSTYKNIDLFGSLIVSQVPLVFVDRHVDTLPVPLVHADNQLGGYQAARHLLELGHKRIAFVCSIIKNLHPITDRYAGYCRALLEAGIVPMNEWLISSEDDQVLVENTPHSDIRMHEAHRQLDRLLALPSRPTAVMVENDVSAIYFQRAALQRNIAIPEEMSIIGFDNLSSTAYLEVPLTTIEQDFIGIGREAARLLLESSQPPSSAIRRVLETQLIVRQSTGVVPAH